MFGMNADFYREELCQMRENYKNDPPSDIKLRPPKWLNPEDPMYELFLKKSTLLQQGEITYASIVQANTILFRRYPPLNCPAHIIFPSDSHREENPEVLFDIAWRIYGYKGKPPDDIPNEWKEIARVVTDEYDRTGFTISLEADGCSREYRMIPTMIYRKLLPKRKLCGNLLPVLRVADCKQIFILPKQYWTKAFRKVWTKGMI